MKMLFLTMTLLSTASFAQSRPTLEEVSKEMNKDLPEIYDHMTKLMRTSVENNNLKYQFLINADQKEYNWALPKVRTQILSNICKNSRQKAILKNYRANIVYSYENVKGQSLGEFMVKPDHCN